MSWFYTAQNPGLAQDICREVLEQGGRLCHVGALVHADEDLVEQGLEVVASHSVHDKPLQGRHDHVVVVVDEDVQVDQTKKVEAVHL